jgi:hypothetical protein
LWKLSARLCFRLSLQLGGVSTRSRLAGSHGDARNRLESDPFPTDLDPFYLGESGMAKHNPNKLQEHGRAGAFWEQQETPYCVPDVSPAF